MTCYRCELKDCQPEEIKRFKEFCKVQKVLYFEKIATGENQFYMYYVSAGNKKEDWMDVERVKVISIPSGAKRCSQARMREAIGV